RRASDSFGSSGTGLLPSSHDPIDEDGDTEVGDSEVSVSLGKLSSGGKKSQESNIGDTVHGDVVTRRTSMAGKRKVVIVKNQEPLPEDILRVTNLRHTGSHYPKTYWKSLPEDMLGVITRRHARSHYPKTYWESLPEDILGVIT
nr:hypothetical protein [Tanacetum cinerariifolium]